MGIKNFKKAKAKSHSSEALLEIIQRQITRETHRQVPVQGSMGRPSFLLVHVCSESSERKPGAEQCGISKGLYLQLFTELYLNNHYSMIIGKLHWKVLYKKDDFQIEKWISL